MLLFFDTETTGLPDRYDASFDDTVNWPRLVQIAWAVSGDASLAGATWRVAIIRPNGFTIPEKSTKVHGITHAWALERGEPLHQVMQEFNAAADRVQTIVGHNLRFDVPVVACELLRLGSRWWGDRLVAKPRYDTLLRGMHLCKIPDPCGCGYKYPKLAELYRHLFGRDPDNQHRADGDVLATAECYYKMIELESHQVSRKVTGG